MNTVRANCMLKDLKQIMTSEIRYKFERHLSLDLDTQGRLCAGELKGSSPEINKRQCY